MVEKKTSDIVRLVFGILFFCLVIFSIAVGLVLSYNVTHLPDHNQKTEQLVNWTVTDKSGKSFKTNGIYFDNRFLSEDFTITTKLPEKIETGSVLYFQNRSNFRVYIGGELRKTFDKYKNTSMPGGAMKEFYADVYLSKEDSGAELKIIREQTDWSPALVSETFVTSPEGFYQFMVGKYGVSFTMTLCLFVASLLSMLIAVFLQIRNKQKLDVVYAALGVLDVSCWLLAVSPFTPFITGIYYVDGLMGFFFCMMMPFALIIYVNSIQKRRYNKLYSVLMILSLLNFIFWTVMHFTGVSPFQHSLIFIDSLLGIVVLGAFSTFFLDIRKGRIMEYIHTAAGFLVFMVMGIFEIFALFVFQNDFSQISMICGLACLLVFVITQQVEDIRRERKRLESEVRDRTLEKEQMLIHIVKTLAGTIDAKDTYTKGHSSRVADYSKEIAKRSGYSESRQNDIYMMALLHDIGKIGIPDAVINKPGRLTDEEFELIKKHPVIGARILENISEKAELATGARSHHEKYNGKGYPDGLRGEDIPETARIIAVADAYDAMTSFRSYRDPMTQSSVREEIVEGSGVQFDPRFAEIMVGMIDEDKDYRLREMKKSVPLYKDASV